MLDAWGDHPAVRADAGRGLRRRSARTSAALIHEGPKEQLDLTTNTQPVMLAAGDRLLPRLAGRDGAGAGGRGRPFAGRVQRAGGRGVADAGRRAAAGALSRAGDAGGGAGRRRARWRRSSAWTPRPCATAAPKSAAAVGEPVEAANFNDPKQTVIAGTKAGVDKACEVLKARGAKRALPLAVSAPFHSSLMKPAAERLKERLATVTLRRAGDPGDQQHRRGGADRAGRDPRRAVPPGLRPGALGRDRAGDPRARRHAPVRVRPGQGAGRPGQAHRRRAWWSATCSTRRRWPKRKGMLA